MNHIKELLKKSLLYCEKSPTNKAFTKKITLNTSTSAVKYDLGTQSTAPVPLILKCIEKGFRIDKRNNLFKILDFLLTKALMFRSVHHAQATVGKACGLTREHTNRLLQQLQTLGLIRIKSGKKTMETCRYIPNSGFFGKYRRELSRIFRCLQIFSIALLMPFNDTIITPCLRIKKDIKRVSNSIRVRDTLATHIFRTFYKNDRYKMDRSHVSPTIRQLADRIGLNKAGMLLFLAFEDEVIRYVYNQYRDNRHSIYKPAQWIWRACRMRSEQLTIPVYMDTMQSALDAIGFKKGDPVTFSDPESQPAFREKIHKGEGRKHHNNPDLNSFPNMAKSFDNKQNIINQSNTPSKLKYDDRPKFVGVSKLSQSPRNAFAQEYLSILFGSSDSK